MVASAGESRSAPAFWIPEGLRERVLQDATFDVTWVLRGDLAESEMPGATGAVWPRLTPGGWRSLWDGLRATPAIPLSRIQAGIHAVGQRLRDPDDPLHESIHALVSPCTGYSREMLDFAFGFFENLDLGSLQKAAKWVPPPRVRKSFVPLPGSAGRVRFYASSFLGRMMAGLGGGFAAQNGIPATFLGFAAGNIPGAALLIFLLGQVLQPRPATIVRNSRREPFFTPLFLSALEEVDPELVSNVAIMLWDYNDTSLQMSLLREAGSVCLVAGDDTIRRIEADIARSGAKPRVHRHGHKVSFIVVARSALSEDRLHQLAPLAALDTLIWDQNGCLSPRLHFVETGGSTGPEDYAAAVTEALGALAVRLPGGLVDLRRLHSRFDKYHAVAAGGRASVHSRYDDAFLVVVDRRPYTPFTLAEAISDARDRTVIVKPVPDLGAIPRDYLQHLPTENLQTLSVAMDSSVPEFDRFADEVGRSGITALRTVGRAAFPNLACSWDGELPSDLVTHRPAGHYTSIEFDDALAQTEQTAMRLCEWLQKE